MIRRVLPRHAAPRRGAAAVEFAVILAFAIIPMMIGLLQMGRAVQVQQIVANAARDGARLAAQGRTVNQVGATTNIYADRQAPLPTNLADTQPNIHSAVYQSLVGAGLTQLKLEDVTVEFEFKEPDPKGGGFGTDPHQGVKSQLFAVRVSIDYDKVSWINFTPVANYNQSQVYKPTTITYAAGWRMLVDDPFEANSTVPTW